MTKRDKTIKELKRDFFQGIGVPKETAFKPDEFQLEAIKLLEERVDTLVIAPTGAGKTYIAIEAIRATMARGEKAVYTAPLKAVSNAKYADFKRRFEPEYSVGILTGDRKIASDSSVVVATTEIYRNELYSGEGRYSLVVLDEFHYLADPQRGPVWEESIILSPQTATLLLLSASISNAQQVAAWIEEVRKKPVRIVTVKERPVALRLGFLHSDFGVIPLLDDDGQILPEVNHYYSGDRMFFPKGARRGSYRGNRRRG
ncbi:DEAD/DEAH box helicase [bacterium]|nr:DEAD/DEAH box helicase [bacterium]